MAKILKCDVCGQMDDNNAKNEVREVWHEETRLESITVEFSLTATHHSAMHADICRRCALSALTVIYEELMNPIRQEPDE